jgi:hypothetical protein
LGKVERLLETLVALGQAREEGDMATFFGIQADHRISNWAYFWDFLLRLFSAYFIFQTVRAFRKYTRLSP